MALAVLALLVAAAWGPRASVAGDDDADVAGREAVYGHFAMGVYLLERGEASRAKVLCVNAARLYNNGQLPPPPDPPGEVMDLAAWNKAHWHQ